MENETKTITPEQFAKLGSQLESIVKSDEKRQETINELKAGYTTISENLDVEVGKARKDIAAIKQALTAQHGKSGGEDWLHEMAKFLTSVFCSKHGMRVPESARMSDGTKLDDLAVENEKAAADFTTGSSAAPYAGYLLPEILRPGVIELKDIYGNLYPKLTTFQTPAGVNVHMPKDAASPAAVYRVAGQVATMGEEATPMTFGRGTINTMLIGRYIQIANELLNNPSVGFGAVATVRMLRAILKGTEKGVLQGDAGVDAPSDGLLIDSSVNDQGNIATATFANVVSFLQACITDDNSASDARGKTILMDPSSLLSLASEAVGDSELTGMLVWGNPRTGAPTTLLGYEIMSHPSMVVSAQPYIGLADLSNIFLGEDPSFTVDINPWLKDGFVENASWLRVFTHNDWELGQPGEMHYATIGA